MGANLKINKLLYTCLLTSFGWSQLSQAQVANGKSYQIFSACDLNKVMGITNNSLADKALVVLQTKSSEAAQIFKFESASSGYNIKAQNSGKYFNIVDASSAKNAALEQYKFLTGQASEQFLVSNTSDGYTRLQNVNSKLYLNLRQANTADGTQFEQYLDTTACAEKFKLVEVSTVAPPPPTPPPTNPPPVTPGSRDPLKQPFSSTSIWNMPIGSNAQYAAANLSGTPGNNIWAGMPGADQEQIVLTPTAPLVNINYSSVGWSGGNRCVATGGLIVSVPMPSNYIIPNSTSNSSAVFLMPDRRSLIHAQPVARCIAGGSATALLKFNTVDLYGTGITGSHGGSGMSAIGGSIRMGELRPGQQGPRHALKMNVYAKEALYKCTTRTDCFRWPAVTADSYAVGFYGTGNNNSNSQMKMGSLLALAPNISVDSLGLETAPAKQLAWTLQNYGAYIVDDTYAAGVAFNIETGPNGSKAAEFQADYGFSFQKKVNDVNSSPWARDIQRLLVNLKVITNNTANTVGGGGTPRQPMAAPIAP